MEANVKSGHWHWHILTDPEGIVSHRRVTRHHIACTPGKRSLPLPFAGSEAILAAISAGETPTLPGGVNAYHPSNSEARRGLQIPSGCCALAPPLQKGVIKSDAHELGECKACLARTLSRKASLALPHHF